MPNRIMSDFWQDTMNLYYREHWFHMAEAAKEVWQYWLSKEDKEAK